jgi:hypothetical protein
MESPVRNERRTPGSEGGARNPPRGKPGHVAERPSYPRDRRPSCGPICRLRWPGATSRQRARRRPGAYSNRFSPSCGSSPATEKRRRLAGAPVRRRRLSRTHASALAPAIGRAQAGIPAPRCPHSRRRCSALCLCVYDRGRGGGSRFGQTPRHEKRCHGACLALRRPHSRPRPSCFSFQRLGGR